MLRNRICKNAGFALTGFVAGITSMLALGFAKEPNEAGKEVLPKNTFGDLRIVTVPPEGNDVSAEIAICKGNVPVVHFLKNDSNEVDRFGLTNGKNGMLALGRLAKSGVSEFEVYGNAVNGGRRTPVLFLLAPDKSGVWHKVIYAPTVATVYDDQGKLARWRAVGELYFDFDFDGQLDAKQIWDDKSAVVSESIFIKGEWCELGRMDSSGQWKRAGCFDPEKLSAYTIDGGKQINFDFVWGKGWQERAQ